MRHAAARADGPLPSVVVLGLDPGSRVTGFGVVRETSGTLELVSAGTIRTATSQSLDRRLAVIFEGVRGIIAEHGPLEAALEDVFVSVNAASALKLGQARGAAMVACSTSGLSVHSYAPSQVKMSLVGAGRAAKEQVAFMVSRLLGARLNLALDATDALAVAICHLNERRFRRLAELAARGRGA